MAYSLNKVMLIGNVGQDPKIINGANGKFASFSLATSETWVDKNTKEKKTKTEWHNVVIYNEALANIIEKTNVKKGTKLYIEGTLATRKWTDKDNNERYTTEIILQGFNGSIILLGDNGGPRDNEEGEHSAPKKVDARSNKSNDDEYNDFLNDDFGEDSDKIPF